MTVVYDYAGKWWVYKSKQTENTN